MLAVVPDCSSFKVVAPQQQCLVDVDVWQVSAIAVTFTQLCWTQDYPQSKAVLHAIAFEVCCILKKKAPLREMTDCAA